MKREITMLHENLNRRVDRTISFIPITFDNDEFVVIESAFKTGYDWNGIHFQHHPKNYEVLRELKIELSPLSRLFILNNSLQLFRIDRIVLIINPIIVKNNFFTIRKNKSNLENSIANIEMKNISFEKWTSDIVINISIPNQCYMDIAMLLTAKKSNFIFHFALSGFESVSDNFPQYNTLPLTKEYFIIDSNIKHNFQTYAYIQNGDEFMKLHNKFNNY